MKAAGLSFGLVTIYTGLVTRNGLLDGQRVMKPEPGKENGNGKKPRPGVRTRFA